MNRAIGLGILLAYGCASAPTTATREPKDWRAAAIRKVMVACVQGDQETNRRAEAHVAPILRRQGLDAMPSQELFSAGSEYSPKAVVEQMRRAQVDGIMELTYSGEIPSEGLPRGARFKYHAVKNFDPRLSARRASIDAALSALLAGTK